MLRCPMLAKNMAIILLIRLGLSSPLELVFGVELKPSSFLINIMRCHTFLLRCFIGK